MSPNQKRDVADLKLIQISAMVETGDAADLRLSAKRNDRTFAAEVRRAIRFYLEHGQ